MESKDFVERFCDAVDIGTALAGQQVRLPAERPRHRLGLVVVLQAGELAPAGVTAQLDEACPELDPEQQPAQRERGAGGDEL